MLRRLRLPIFGMLAVVTVLVALAVVPYFVTRTVSEPLPAAGGVSLSTPSVPAAVVTTPPAAPVVAPPAAASPAAAPAFTRLLAGSFTEVDVIHKGEGTATILRTPDGPVLRLESFKVTNGPDLYVYLSAHSAPRSATDLRNGAPPVELAVLKGNVGDQNYPIPASVDLSVYKSVVIYCRAFTTVFSTATLS